jgi:hypothetical protein
MEMHLSISSEVIAVLGYFIFRHHKKTGINLGENTNANIVLKKFPYFFS